MTKRKQVATVHDQAKGLKNLGLFYSQHGKFDEATKYLSELAELRSNEIPHPIEQATDLKLLSTCLVNLDRHDDALSVSYFSSTG